MREKRPEPPPSMGIGEAARLLGVRVGLVRKWLDQYLQNPTAPDNKITGFSLPGSGHRRVYEDSVLKLREEMHGS